MILYIIKTIACSAVLWAVYKLVLENAKMNRFKRMYLLLALVLSFIAPLFEFPTPATTPVLAMVAGFQVTTVTQPASHVPAGGLDYGVWLWILYGAVTAFLFGKYCNNILAFYRKTRGKDTASYRGVAVVFSADATAPYSFWNHIFISREVFNDPSTDDRILCHEAAHVRQWHSLDIVFLELLRTVSWFNPLLYGYKRSIQLNHEFLADEAVLRVHPGAGNYLQLMLHHTARVSGVYLSSSFNFPTTKKRFTMVTKKTSLAAAMGRTAVASLFLAGCLYLFPGRGAAQQPPVARAATKPGPGASDEEMKEARRLIAPYVRQDNNHNHVILFFGEIPDDTRLRLHELFDKMTGDQRASVPFGFERMPPPPPPPPAMSGPVTAQQLESWKDGETYGVWIDEKRIRNASLSKYSGADFATVYVSRLTAVARKNDGFRYQVDLMTHDYYASYYKKAMADTNKFVMIFHVVKDGK